MPDPRHAADLAGLEDRLDALGRHLVASEPRTPPPAVAAAIHTSAAKLLRIRITIGSTVATAAAIVAIAYFASRPAPAPATTPPIVEREEPKREPDLTDQFPTLAILRALNRHASSDSLRLPTGPASSSDPSSRPTDARNRTALDQLLGPAR